MTSLPNNSRDERGVAMLYAAIFLLSSVWLVSLALDMGKLMVTKTELQRTADAAALAAASAVDSQTGLLREDLARDRAYETAYENYALQDSAVRVVIDRDADVDFPGTQHNQVRVRVHRSAETGNPMTTIFARTLGIMSLDVHAVATAEVATINSCGNTPPFAPIQVQAGYDKNCGTEYTFNMDAAGGGPGPLVQAGSPSSTPTEGYILDYGTSCNEGPCSEVSGDPLTCYILKGYGCCLKKGQVFNTIPIDSRFSDVTGALKERWEADNDRSEGICYADYTGNGSRVLICPIVTIEPTGGGGGDDDGKNNGNGSGSNGRNISFSPQGTSGGTESYRARIVGFTGFFLTREPKANKNELITGQFIDYLGSGDPEGTAMSNRLYGTRLVE